MTNQKNQILQFMELFVILRIGEHYGPKWLLHSSAMNILNPFRDITKKQRNKIFIFREGKRYVHSQYIQHF